MVSRMKMPIYSIRIDPILFSSGTLAGGTGPRGCDLNSENRGFGCCGLDGADGLELLPLDTWGNDSPSPTMSIHRNSCDGNMRS